MEDPPEGNARQEGDLEARLGEHWDDAEGEYQVLSGLLVPAAQARFDRAVSDWDALDTKAMGFLALDAALIAGLVATHESIHELWWLPALGGTVAAAFFIGLAVLSLSLVACVPLVIFRP